MGGALLPVFFASRWHEGAPHSPALASASQIKRGRIRGEGERRRKKGKTGGNSLCVGGSFQIFSFSSFFTVCGIFVCVRHGGGGGEGGGGGMDSWTDGQTREGEKGNTFLCPANCIFSPVPFLRGNVKSRVEGGRNKMPFRSHSKAEKGKALKAIFVSEIKKTFFGSSPFSFFWREIWGNRRGCS